MGMGGPEEKRAAKGPMWTKAYGRTVDLTNFRHPGGAHTATLAFFRARVPN